MFDTREQKNGDDCVCVCGSWFVVTRIWWRGVLSAQNQHAGIVGEIERDFVIAMKLYYSQSELDQ